MYAHADFFLYKHPKIKNMNHLKNYDDKIDLNISAKRKILHTP